MLQRYCSKSWFYSFHLNIGLWVERWGQVLLGLCESVESESRSTKKCEGVDHVKKKEEDRRKSSLFTMMNNDSVSMSEARAIYKTLTFLSAMYYHIWVYYISWICGYMGGKQCLWKYEWSESYIWNPNFPKYYVLPHISIWCICGYMGGKQCRCKYEWSESYIWNPNIPKYCGGYMGEKQCRCKYEWSESYIWNPNIPKYYVLPHMSISCICGCMGKKPLASSRVKSTYV